MSTNTHSPHIDEKSLLDAQKGTRAITRRFEKKQHRGFCNQDCRVFRVTSTTRKYCSARPCAPNLKAAVFVRSFRVVAPRASALSVRFGQRKIQAHPVFMRQSIWKLVFGIKLHIDTTKNTNTAAPPEVYHDS